MSIILAVSLVNATAIYSGTLAKKDSEIKDLTSTLLDKNSQIKGMQDKIEADNASISLLAAQSTALQYQLTIANSQISFLNSQITALQDQVRNSSSQISSLNSQITILQEQVRDLTAIIETNKSSVLSTLVFHVSEKGEGYVWGRLPDANFTYDQILKLNNGTYDIILVPEYKGNENWSETFTWLAKNFKKIPIMLSVFEGGPHTYPVPKLTIDEINETVTACNVKWIRIFETVSWHIEHNLTYPIDYVRNILAFAREHGLRVQWSEWKVGDNVFQRVKSYIAGFEDIVTVCFQTNSGELEPVEGFALVGGMFQHWGGSVQSWYWTTRYGSEPTDMPASLLVQHAVAAQNMGTEILQFEPYWYFFDNGEPKESLDLLMVTLTH